MERSHGLEARIVAHGGATERCGKYTLRAAQSQWPQARQAGNMGKRGRFSTGR
jgi:hypothetical protein